MQSNLHASLQTIQDWFKQNPLTPNSPLEIKFDLNVMDAPEHVEIEIHQYIFRRATVIIQKEAGAGFTVSYPGSDAVSGPDDLAALKEVLVTLGFVRTAKQNLASMFAGAKRTKHKYPRKGKVRRA